MTQKGNQKQNSYSTHVKHVKNIFSQYSVEDVACFLFISSMWLHNINSPYKHLFMTAIFASMVPKEFQCKKTIATYEDFSIMLISVFKHTPSFPTLEDYISEQDGGVLNFIIIRRTIKYFMEESLMLLMII